jgi:hypothetical protein
MIDQARSRGVVRRMLAPAAVALVAVLGGACPALGAPLPRWSLQSIDAPANLPPGGSGEIIAEASNVGDAGTSKEFTIGDKLPSGVTLKPDGIHAWPGFGVNNEEEQLKCDPTLVTCSTTKELQSGTRVRMLLEVNIAPGATGENEVTASGGGAAPAAVKQAVSFSTAPPRFGIEKYSFVPEEEDGTPDRRAGSHPFQLSTTLTLSENARQEPVQLPKNFDFELPPGMIGNPTSLPQCTAIQFYTLGEFGRNDCPVQSAIGLAEVTIKEPNVYPRLPATLTVPVFNIEPTEGSSSDPFRGEPAKLGLVADNVPVTLDTAVRTGSDYGVNVFAHEASQAAGVISTKVIVWGTPGDPVHDAVRGWKCVNNESLSAECLQQTKELAEKRTEPPKPFLDMPTSCAAPLRSPMTAESWLGSKLSAPVESEFVDTLEEGSCAALPFAPEMEVTPDSKAASTPTGLTVKIKMAQEETEGGVNATALRSTTVTLPEGLQLNPAAAGGLQACTTLQVGFLGAEEVATIPQQLENDHFNPNPIACPEEAKVGTVEVISPDLFQPIKGAVYLGKVDTEPFQSPLVGYIVAQDPISGVLVKLAGAVIPDETTGRIFSTFENTPQVPFKEFQLHFFGGPRASLSTPEVCGSYQTNATFTPWSGQPNKPVLTEPFVIDQGCPPGNAQQFAPAVTTGVSNPQAGEFTSFALNLGRPDGQQAVTGVSVHLPAGMAALLSSITPCPIAQAEAAQCTESSLVGHSTTYSGLGTEPFALPGNVYLTGPYNGAPFGLSVATHAKAGPFDLGMIVANSTIQVDPNTAAVTVTAVQTRIIDQNGSRPLGNTPVPTRVKGVPVQLKALRVSVDRPNFQFNPTTCNELKIEGALAGAQGGSAPISYPFKAANCESLPFAPKLTAVTAAKASKLNGVEFDVTVESPGLHQASIEKVFLTLPKALPSRLTTIQKACPDALFNANPATCPEGSLIGHAIIHTPVLTNPLSGPAYLVSHGGAAFPDVEFVLQGEGILLILDGKTDIKNGITYSRFESAPDAPFTKFETILPEGPHSALTAYTPSNPFNLCGSNLEMPTEFTAHNGAVIKQTTKIGIKGGCSSTLAHKESALEKALKACRKKFKGKKKHKKLVACERAARKKFGPKKHSKAKKGKKH